MDKNKKNKDECIKNYNLAKDFFKGNLSVKDQDKIYTHLLQCKDCLKSYKFYSKAVRNEDFKLIESAVNFCNLNIEKTLKTRKILEKQGITGLYDLDTKYESIAKEFKLSKLKDVEAVCNLFTGDETIESIKDGDLLLNFTKYLCYNICKEVDLLERCYRKGIGVVVDEKS